MDVRHRVVVTDRRTEEETLRCNVITVRERILRWLFGAKQKVLVIAPSDSVFSIDVREENLRDIFDGYLQDVLDKAQTAKGGGDR